ncbi:MAG TPA: hypothetical protein VKU41_31805, partial [Polyangiaceae bacterium]|nr:hypothetical protein [Polyangiaceae bacterium]
MGPAGKGVVKVRPGLLLPPVVLWAWGCAAWEANPPVATPIDWGQGPTLRSMELPSKAEALRRWTVPPSDPWSPYAKYTLLTALNDGPVLAALPDVEQLDEVQRARAAATRIGTTGLPDGTLWIVDLRGAASVAFGTALAATPGAGAVSL